MIQFNLLPDVKIAYLKARRQKHLVVLVSAVATLTGVAILVILTSVVYVAQKKNISDLSKDIKSNAQKLQSTPDLNKILTVQNQLTALPGLHEAKPQVTRLATYLSEVTPGQASIDKLTVNFEENTITINGAADSNETINKFTDTLKFTTYAPKDSTEKGKAAFTNVVLATFTRTTKNATYTITTNFDPAIFSQAQDIVLTVPQIISTRSALEQPTALFQDTGTNTTTGSGQ